MPKPIVRVSPPKSALAVKARSSVRSKQLDINPDWTSISTSQLQKFSTMNTKQVKETPMDRIRSVKQLKPFNEQETLKLKLKFASKRNSYATQTFD